MYVCRLLSLRICQWRADSWEAHELRFLRRQIFQLGNIIPTWLSSETGDLNLREGNLVSSTARRCDAMSTLCHLLRLPWKIVCRKTSVCAAVALIVSEATLSCYQCLQAKISTHITFTVKYGEWMTQCPKLTIKFCWFMLYSFSNWYKFQLNRNSVHWIKYKKKEIQIISPTATKNLSFVVKQMHYKISQHLWIQKLLWPCPVICVTPKTYVWEDSHVHLWYPDPLTTSLYPFSFEDCPHKTNCLQEQSGVVLAVHTDNGFARRRIFIPSPAFHLPGKTQYTPRNGSQTRLGVAVAKSMACLLFRVQMGHSKFNCKDF